MQFDAEPPTALPVAGQPTALPPAATLTIPVGKGAVADARTKHCAARSVRAAACSSLSLPRPRSPSESESDSVMSVHRSTLMRWRNVLQLSPPCVLAQWIPHEGECKRSTLLWQRSAIDQTLVWQEPAEPPSRHLPGVPGLSVLGRSFLDRPVDPPC